jgi:hypothetical protein
MFTTEEVRAIPILSAVPQAELERLAKNAADIRLAAGEWAVHEGDERAFYAVISEPATIPRKSELPVLTPPLGGGME